MNLTKYFFHAFLGLFFSNLILAGTGVVTYEKFYRLNNPQYQSDFGDWLGFSYKSIEPVKRVDTFFQGDLRLYFEDNNSVNYSLQEAYLNYINENYNVSLGRKILDWNQNEKYWGLGYLNGIKGFSLLGDDEEGVTGVHYLSKHENFSYEILFSYLFIPQINPELKIENGNVESKSEWMRLPPRSTVINGSTVPIYYRIMPYRISRILFNKSLGGNVRFKYKNGFFSMFAIYKPENKLRVNAEAYYDNTGLNQVVVSADPTVNHHANMGVQWDQEFGDVKVKTGLSYVDPNAKIGKDMPLFDLKNSRKTFSSEYFSIAPRYDREVYAHMSANIFRRKYDLSLNYIHLLSENIRGADDFFSDAVKWKNALGGSVKYYFNDYFNCLLDLKYDLERRDNIFKSEIKYNWRNYIYAAMGIELLMAPDDTSYWSYYRASDTIYSSVGLFF